jgi:membrane protein
MRNIIGPKIVEPVAAWYEEHAADQTDDAADGPGEADTGTAETPRAETHADGTDETETIDLRTSSAAPSTTLASAQAAEAFFAGPRRGDEPLPTAAPGGDAGIVATVIDVPLSGAAAVKDIGMRVKSRIKSHNLAVVAAGIAFWGLLAIPALLTAVLSIYGLFADPANVEGQIEDNLGSLPEEARSLIVSQLEAVAGADSGGLAVGAAIGILLALWTSSGAVAKLIATLNTIWGVEEDRKFLKLRGLALAITLGAIVFVTGSAFLLAVLPPILTEVGLADLGRWLINAGRFPALVAFMTGGLTTLYWIGPNRRSKWRAATWGAFVATLLWVVVSGLFTIYTARFSSYNETYGSLGAVVILLMWLFLTAFMVLVGAEIDAAREERAAEASGVGAGS